MVHLADIKFGDLGRKTDWRIFSLADNLIHIGIGTGGAEGATAPNILLCIKKLTVIKD